MEPKNNYQDEKDKSVYKILIIFQVILLFLIVLFIYLTHVISLNNIRDKSTGYQKTIDEIIIYIAEVEKCPQSDVECGNNVYTNQSNHELGLCKERSTNLKKIECGKQDIDHLESSIETNDDFLQGVGSTGMLVFVISLFATPYIILCFIPFIFYLVGRYRTAKKLGLIIPLFLFVAFIIYNLAAYAISGGGMLG